MSACQPCKTSSFKKMVEAILARGARKDTTFREVDSNDPCLGAFTFCVVNGGTALISLALALNGYST
jgi:hypothetical protein